MPRAPIVDGVQRRSTSAAGNATRSDRRIEPADVVGRAETFGSGNDEHRLERGDGRGAAEE